MRQDSRPSQLLVITCNTRQFMTHFHLGFRQAFKKKGWHFLLEGFRLMTLYRYTGVLGGAHTALMLRDKKGSDVSEGESNFFIAL